MQKLTNEDCPVKIEHDMKYEGMYRLVWADNLPSAECYNLTRAHDILKNYKLYRKHMQTPDPSWLIKGVFDCEI